MRSLPLSMACFALLKICGSSDLPPAASGESVVVAPMHGGVMVAADDAWVELVAKQDGDVEAYVVDARGQPLPAAQAQVTAVQLQGSDGRPHEVQLEWDPQGARYQGHVAVAPVAAPAQVHVVVAGQPRHLAAPQIIIVAPTPGVVVEARGRGRAREVQVEAPRPTVVVEAPRPTVVVEAPRPTVVVQAPQPAVVVQAPRPPGVVVVPPQPPGVVVMAPQPPGVVVVPPTPRAGVVVTAPRAGVVVAAPRAGVVVAPQAGVVVAPPSPGVVVVGGERGHGHHEGHGAVVVTPGGALRGGGGDHDHHDDHDDHGDRGGGRGHGRGH